ncbi:ABC transporter ATP-binding protein [Dactylosporangium siamense]|uniref:HlyB/MsbA family ABC transporter n=1 Tax=Dactylosporangium siamense TaxID=685454 RepID=A0A919PYB2_9ACTN|nr:ABC transporter ATP-binding protein [Dactylosporangium siamense]GIG52995.1 HlyB/MsbA family ABC transporter [Dactylosporangium siamense]
MTERPTSVPGPRIRGFRGMMRAVAAAIRLVWRASRREFLIVVAMDVLQAVGIFVLVIQVQKVLSSLIGSDNGASAPALASNLIIFISANIVIVLAEAVIANRRTMLGERTSIYACGEVIGVVSQAELDDFDNSRFHDRLQRASASAQHRPIQMVSSLTLVMQALFTVISLWIALSTIQPVIAVCVLAVIFPVWIGGTRGGEQYYEFVKETTSSDRGRSYLYVLLTTRDPAKEVRAYNLADHLATTWRDSMNERLRLLGAMLRRRLRSSMISSLGSNAVIALVAGGLILLTHYHVLSLAQTATLAGILLVLSQKLMEAISATNAFFESAPLIADLDEFLALGPKLRGRHDGVPAPAQFSRIELDGLGFTYQDAERPAVRDVSLRIEAGQVVALVGENGSGKTTLAKLLAGLYTPQTGAVRVDGVDLRDIDTEAWRNSVAVLFQDFIKYAMPAADNIRLGAVEREPGPDDIHQAARAAGADGFLSALPEGYDTMLSPQFGDGQDLSLGQWQRVALARAFFRSAPVVVLDEPSAALDARAERALFDSVRELYRNRTVLLISHRFSTVRTADHIVVLEQGRIVEQGNHASLMAAGGLYAELFSIQASGFLDDEDVEAVIGDGIADEPVQMSTNPL